MLALVFLFFSLVNGPLPDPTQLIQRALALHDTQQAKGWKFTWREEVELRDEKGRPLKPFRRACDVIMLEGESYRKRTQPTGTSLR
jgi:hypothetical protein